MRSIRDTLASVWAVGIAGVVMWLVHSAAPLLGISATLVDIGYPLVGFAVIVAMTGTVLQMVPADAGGMKRRVGTLVVCMVGQWFVLVGEHQGIDGMGWAKGAAACVGALLAQEGRLARFSPVDGADRIIEVDDREAAIVAMMLTAGAIAMLGIGHHAEMMALHRSFYAARGLAQVGAEATAYVGVVMVLGFAVLLLRVGIDGGEIRAIAEWKHGWVAAGDHVVDVIWRCTVIGLLCALATMVPGCLQRSIIIGPVLVFMTGVALTAAAIQGMRWVAHNVGKSLQSEDGLAGDEGVGVMWLVVTALGLFWVALILEWMVGWGQAPLLMSGVAAIGAAGMMINHVQGDLRDGVVELVWLGLAAAAVVGLLVIPKPTSLGRVMTVLAVLGVAGLTLWQARTALPALRRTGLWQAAQRFWQHGDADQRTSRGGRAQEDAHGEKLRDE